MENFIFCAVIDDNDSGGGDFLLYNKRYIHKQPSRGVLRKKCSENM